MELSLENFRDGLSDANLKSGRAVQARWQDTSDLFHRELRKAFQRYHASDVAFTIAVQACVGGKPQELVSYLRSRHPLCAWHREYLATFLEGSSRSKKESGRPRSHDNRSAAIEALALYRLWRAENKRLGIRDHGQGGAMQREAVRFTIEKLKITAVVHEKVLALMKRPKHRRN